jgi:hypothetical protein
MSTSSTSPPRTPSLSPPRTRRARSSTTQSQPGSKTGSKILISDSTHLTKHLSSKVLKIDCYYYYYYYYVLYEMYKKILEIVFVFLYKKVLK